MRRTDPSALAWLAGNELRQARERLGLTQAAAAAEIGCSTSRMNYLESGRTVQQPADVRALMRLYGEPGDGDRLAALLDDPGRRAWWAPWRAVVPEAARLRLGLEALAGAVYCYRPQLVPELLQVDGYASALVSASLGVSTGVGSPVAAQRVVELRAARQRGIAEAGTALSVVLDEEALARPVGGPGVLRAQLARLLAPGDRCQLRVMPRTVAVHDGLDGGFTVLEFGSARPVAHLGDGEHGSYLAERHAVAAQLYRRDRMLAAALDPAASRELVRARLTALG
jgi:transcriptional regulator with XRE-family HTH domain